MRRAATCIVIEFELSARPAAADGPAFLQACASARTQAAESEPTVTPSGVRRRAAGKGTMHVAALRTLMRTNA